MRSLLLLLLLLLLPALSSATLFSSDDPAVIFDAGQRKGENGVATLRRLRLETSPSSLLLILYSSMCGHCISYAPKFRIYAKQLKEEFGSNLRIVSVDCINNRDTCNAAEVRGTPTIKLFVAPGNLDQSGALLAENQVVGRVKELMGAASRVAPSVAAAAAVQMTQQQQQQIQSEQQQQQQLVVLPKNLEKASSSASGLLDPLSPGSREKIIHDAAMAIRFGLETGIFGSGKEVGERERLALDNWLALLAEGFPGEAERQQLRQLHRLLGEKSEPLTSASWSELLRGFNFPDTIAYSKKNSATWWHCVEKGNRGGYPCGLWILFHVLAANTPLTTTAMPPKKVAMIIHDFIKYFSTCSECRDNFLRQNPDVTSMFTPDDSIEENKKQLVLWLWREHNSVSTRLNQEIAHGGSESQTKPAVASLHEIFPTPDHCPACFKSNSIEYNIPIMYQFIQCYYSSVPEPGTNKDKCSSSFFVKWEEEKVPEIHESHEDDYGLGISRGLMIFFFLILLGIFALIFLVVFPGAHRRGRSLHAHNEVDSSKKV